MRKLFILAIWVITITPLWAFAPSAEEAMVNAYGRTAVTLNGTWNIIVDPFRKGMDESRPYYRNQSAQNDTDFYEYSFDGGRQLSVPGDWNHQYADLDYYEGLIWYGRYFDAPSTGVRQFLYFGGVNARCQVYLNGTLIGTHEGGFTPFQFEISALLKDKGNFLCVAVDNSRTKDAIPSLSFDWWNYGGITRDVLLISTGETYIKDYFIRLKKGTRNRIKAEITLSGENPENQRVRLSIPEVKQERIFASDKKGRISAEFVIPGLELWSPDKPKTYEISLALLSDGIVKDSLCDTIGFRDIAVKGNKILLNGEPIFLRGISFHEEIAAERRRAVSPSDAAFLIDRVKELGCNFVRLAHYPQNEYILRAAENAGIIVWEEIPLWQNIDFEDNETYLKAELYLKEMILRDRNRCAIGLWSLSNETRPGASRDKFMSALLDAGREMDGSRLFTSAFSNVSYNDESRTVILHDNLAAKMDVVGLNMYLGWYVPWPSSPNEIRWQVYPDKPLLFSEFGGEALAGLFGDEGKASSWSEDYQAALYRKNLEMMNEIPNLAGVIPWILQDFRSPFRQLPGLQDGWNRKGLLSPEGQKKKAWHVMEKYYKQ